MPSSHFQKIFASLSGSQSFDGNFDFLNLVLRYLFDIKQFELTDLQIGNGNLLYKRFLRPARTKHVLALVTFLPGLLSVV